MKKIIFCFVGLCYVLFMGVIINYDYRNYIASSIGLFNKNITSKYRKEYKNNGNIVRIFKSTDSIETNDLYKVYVKLPNTDSWKKVDVYNVINTTINGHDKGSLNENKYLIGTGGIASFDFKGKVDVKVVCNTKFSKYRIRPNKKSEGNGKEIYFTLYKPTKISIELYQDDDWQTLTNLNIFASNLEKNNEIFTENDSKKSDNIIYFGPGYHDYTNDDNIKKVVSKNTAYGVLKLKSNQTVYIDGGAFIDASIEINNLKNVKILGRGYISAYKYLKTLNSTEIGQVANKQGVGIKVRKCDNLTIKGITIMGRSTGINGIDVDNETIDDVKVYTSGVNGDGIDIWSSRNVLLVNSFIRSNDDSIALFASRGDSGFKTGTFANRNGNTLNVNIKNNVIWNDDAHAIQIGTHGYYADVKKRNKISNINFKNINILETKSISGNGQAAITFTVRDYNEVSNITFDNIKLENISDAGIVGLYQTASNQGQSPSTNLDKKYTVDDLKHSGYIIKNIRFKNIYYTSSNNYINNRKNRYLIELYGYDKDNDGTRSLKYNDGIISGIYFENIKINKLDMNIKNIVKSNYLNMNKQVLNVYINNKQLYYNKIPASNSNEVSNNNQVNSDNSSSSSTVNNNVSNNSSIKNKVYVERYNSGYYIYIPAKSSDKFVRYDFRHIVNSNTKSDGYGLYQISSTSYIDGKFNYIRDITLSNANIECAVKLNDHSRDFMGIVNHGYEITKSMNVIVDNNDVTNMSVGSVLSGSNIRVKMWNLMYNPNNINENVISRGVNYYVNTSGLVLVQNLKFKIDTPVKYIYMGMLPIIATDNSGVVTSAVKIDDGAVRKPNEVINEGSRIGAKKYEVFSDTSGVFASIILNSSNDNLYCDKSSSFISRNGNTPYNKVYFRYCDSNFAVKTNQELNQSILYSIDLKK